MAAKYFISEPIIKENHKFIFKNNNKVYFVDKKLEQCIFSLDTKYVLKVVGEKDTFGFVFPYMIVNKNDAEIRHLSENKPSVFEYIKSDLYSIDVFDEEFNKITLYGDYRVVSKYAVCNRLLKKVSLF